jgi:two-component system, NarL family, response regulator NreC
MSHRPLGASGDTAPSGRVDERRDPVTASHRVLLADDHVLFRQGLKGLLEREGFTVVAEAGDGREAVRQTREYTPDVAILDLAMPILDGSSAAAEIAQVSPRTRTILLTMHSEEPYIVKAMQAGIKGYVLKSQSAAELVRAIREVVGGGIYLSPNVSRAIAQTFLARNEASSTLTARERQVLLLVAEGKTTKEVAQMLGISAKTADSHRTRIMAKLDIHDTAGLVRYAIRQGLIQP